MKYRCTPIRMAKMLKKKKTDKSGGKDMKPLERAYTIGGNSIWYSHCGK